MWLVFLLPLTNLQQQPSLTGWWEGQSHCVGNHPSCHEEKTLYQFTGAGQSIVLHGFRMAGADTVNMGDLSCTATTAPVGVTCPIPVGTWRFWLQDDHLEGTLTDRDGTVSRQVRATRRRATH